MSADKIQAYLDAVRRLENAQRAVQHYVITIQNAATVLADWRKVSISNSGIGFPPETGTSGRTINAVDWPTAKQLAEALAAWHEAKRLAHASYNDIPEVDRSIIVPPER